MKSPIKKGKVERSKIAVLNKVVRLGLVEKVRSEQRFAGVNYLREQCSRQRERPVPRL